MKIEISKAVAREFFGIDKEIEIEFSYGGPGALPNCYKWPTPWAECWARIRCPALNLDVEESRRVQIPKRSHGRLGTAHEGYAATITGGDILVRRHHRCGRNDPATQRAACEVARNYGTA